jgi:WD40 repeat protein
MSAAATGTSFYVTGGTLQPDAPSYVERQADQELHEALSRGEFCYTLTPRQMGKSSLMIHTAVRLRHDGVTVLVLDLTAIGQNLSPDQWYGGLLRRLSRQLDRSGELEDTLDHFWLTQEQVGPLQRWMEALRDFVLPRCPHSLVLFVDEIDVVRSLPFSTDEFFAGIRECYNRRTQDPEYERLTFCLLGVASPSDLIQDTRISPFNIGRRIELHDFTLAEAAPLAAGLDGATGREGDGARKALLQRVLYWTGGHPDLTQRLCHAVAESLPVASSPARPAAPSPLVDHLCEELFLTRKAREAADNLQFVREHLLRSEVDRFELLELYRRVQQGQRVIDEPADPRASVLRLSGIVRSGGGVLRVRNRIYGRVFDGEWVAAHMPDAELRRQRAAYRRGVLRAAGVAAVIVLGIGGLAWTAFHQAQVARRATTGEAQQRRLAEERERTARHALYAAQMNVAQQSWEEGKVVRARRLLDAQRPQPGQEDLRGFEWRYLWRLTRGDQFLTLHAHSAGVSAVAISPDGRTLASGGPDKSVKLWDLVSGRLVATLSGHTDWVNSVAFSPDGRLLATGCADDVVKLWNVAARREIATWGRHQPPGALADPRGADLAFSPDGKMLATGGGDGRVNLWDLVTRRSLARLSGHQSGIVSLAFCPDGKTLATSSWDATVRLWDVRSKRQLGVLTGHTGSVWSVAFSPDGKTLCTGDYGGAIKLWEVATQRVTARIQGHRGTVDALAFSPDGRTLASGSDDHTAKLWDVATRKQKRWLKGHEERILSLAFSPDGRTLVSGSPDGTIRLWSASATRGADTLSGHTGGIASVAFSPDGRTLATGSGDRTIKLWDTATRQEVVTFEGHRGAVASVAFSPDGKTLASATAHWGDPVPGEVKLWDIVARRELATLLRHPAGVWSVAFSPDGKRLAAGCTDFAVRLYDLAARRELFAFKGLTDSAWSVAFSPDGKILASGAAGGDGEVWLWDIASRRLLDTLRGHPYGVNCVAFSPNGKTLATSGWDQTLKLWDVAGRREIETLEGLTGLINSVVFSPDSRTLASANQDGTVTLWNLAQRQEVVTLRAHAGPVNSVAFSPDGNLLASAGHDGVARLWRAAPFAETDAQVGAPQSRTLR